MKKKIVFKIRFAISKAFNYWANHSEINFSETCRNCTADLVVDFSEGDHGDGYSFDGSSKIAVKSISV